MLITFFFLLPKNHNLHFTIQYTNTHQFWVFFLFLYFVVVVAACVLSNFTFLFCSEHSFHSQRKIDYFRCSYAKIHFSLHKRIYIPWYYVVFFNSIHKDCANNQCLSINLKHECVTAEQREMKMFDELTSTKSARNWIAFTVQFAVVALYSVGYSFSF